jgi:hypothetical protein
MRGGLVFLVSTLLLACAGAPQVRETVARPRFVSNTRVAPSLAKQAQRVLVKHSEARAAKEPDSEDDELEPRDFSGRDVAAPVEEKKKEEKREVDVEGIEGTMSEFDVRVALDERDQDFNHCHDEHRGGSGRIVFRIHINANGDVGNVKARPSKVRNQDLIDCYTEVVSSTHFSKPHGGYADVKWTTKVGRSKKKHDSLYDRPHRFDAPATETRKASSEASAEGHRERRHHRHHRSRRHKKS